MVRETLLPWMLEMYRKSTVSFALLTCLWAAACGQKSDHPGAPVDKVYIVTHAQHSPLFTTHLSTVVRKYGMNPNLGQATDKHGHSDYILDATSPSVRLWSANVLLSGNEDPAKCGVNRPPRSDPGQYFISVNPSTQLSDPNASRILLTKIVKDLQADGYDVRQQPIVCSEQSKSG